MEEQIDISSILKRNEDIVISGIGGRFPESDSVDEFAQNLYNKVDMIVDDDRRWPTELYNMTSRMGKLKAIDRFDGAFFGIMSRIGDTIDPQARILLETTYEAISDAGINPQTLRGTETGVYIGFTSIGMPDGVPEEVQPDLASSLRDSFLYYPGNAKTMYANRVSFVFDFKGPSMVIDTACSSSMVALDVAITDLRLGKCRQAIVGGTHINLQPFTNHMYQSGHVNSKNGISKVWDEDSDGFVRGETVACLFLQKKSDAKRIYATVLHSRTNIDGHKNMGMLFPSSELQKDLMIKTYKEANVDPLKVTYFEAHATGTKVGDNQEAKAIYEAYCKGRTKPLPVGLLKSNIGHGEGASAVASITKVIISYENKCIPANLNLKKLKSAIAEMCPPLLPINDNLNYTPGIVGVNNFGIGGVNGHVLLEPNYKELDKDSYRIVDKIPRLVNLCARNEESLKELFDFIEKNPNKITRDFLALITDTMKIKPILNSSGFPFRGSMLIKKVNGQEKYEYKRQSSAMNGKTLRPVCFFFPGLGGQWPAMAKALMPIDIFANKIEECAQILKPYKIDLKHMLLSDDKNSMSTMTNKFIATTSMQIALVEVLHKLDITPDGIIGHSFGEIACAYADGCLTTEEAVLTSYWRGIITESDNKIPKGLMAAVGLSYNEARKMCPKGVDVVCDNSKDSVTISGLYEETKAFIETLKQKHIFVRELDSSGIPYHSQYLSSSIKEMTDVLKKIIPNPKKRSKKWISTSVESSKPIEEELKNASAEYFVNNLLSPVFFYNSLKTLPSDAIVIEIGPHSLFANIITKFSETVSYVPTVKRDQNDTNLELFLTSIGKLYELGLNPSIENLYPKVEFPVARNTQSISSLIKWDHNEPYFVKRYPEFHFRATASDMNVSISTSLRDDAYLKDHCIDGKVLFPATGYLMLAWRHLASSYGKTWDDLPVVFEDVQFRRPIFLSTNERTKLTVKLHRPTGEFSIIEGNNISSFGRIHASDDSLRNQNFIYDKNFNNKKDFESVTLDTNDIYKELRIRGYDYGPKFRRIQDLRIEDSEKVYGNIEWTGNMIPFMDALLQSQAIALPFRKIFVPVMISSLRCDPKKFFEAIEERKQIIKIANKEETDEELTNEVKEVNEQLEISESDADNDEHKIALKQVVESEVKMFEGVVGDNDVTYRSVLPFFTDISLKMIVTHGIEINGLLAVPIPRKTLTQGLELESYQFIANEENDAIEQIDKKEITEYIQVCSTLAHKASEMFRLKNCENINGYKRVGEELIQHYLKDIKEEHVMLNVLNKILSSIKDENENINKRLDNKNLRQILKSFQNKEEYDLNRDIINQVSKNERFIRPLLDIVSENNVPKKEIKVLEINLSNPIMALETDHYLASNQIYPINVDYTIAHNSIENLHEDYKNKSFKLIEWDQKKASFPSGISIMNLVIFKDSQELWDLDLNENLKEIYDKIANNGFLLSIFRYRFTEPELILNHICNKNDSKEDKIKDINFAKRINDFKNAAQKIGFNVVCRKTDSIGSIAILFRKVLPMDSIKAEDNEILVIDQNYDKWLEVLKDRVKQIIENKENNNYSNTHIWLIANDSSINGIIGLTNCLRQEPGGERIRCIFDYDKQMKLPLDFSSKPFSDILINDLAINIIRDGKLGTYRHLRVPKNHDKIESNDYYLNIGPNGDLTSLQWFDFKNIKPNDTYINVDNRIIPQIRCNIYSTGLNFRDVLMATGRYMTGPEGLFYDCLIGTEFAGRRTDSGERVCGFSISRCIATSVDVREDLITPIPENWSMEDAVTIVTTYCTVWYGLIDRAQLRQNESILIHSGCGGVGQAAITVCQYYNCNIFTTVGNEDKKQFLMKEYNIPEDHIFNSHDIQFEQQIMSITKGKGVNLVLNSLTGEKSEASFRCVSDDGRFVEIGKYDLQMNKQLGMFAFLRNISFHGVTADRMLYLMENEPQKFFNWLHENSNNGCIKPINRTVFKPTEAEQAFRYMTTGKHIGKIVIKMREEENLKIALKGFNPTMKLKATVKTYFNPKKVYIITGGLGGMGLELLHWMIFNGAKKLVLTSRSGIKTNYQRVILSRLTDLGKKYEMFKTEIAISTLNTNTIDGSKQLLEDANRLGPIGGIFHLAVVLNLTLFENQTIEKFRETCESKINTFVNLDKLTRSLCPDLDYFVVFSSIICGKGFSGQSNYGYANSVCERICEMRRRDGLHGLAIQWGPIGDVGLLADEEKVEKIADIIKQRMNSCLEVMDKFVQFPDSILSSTVRANRELLSGSSEDRLLGQFWSALGIDPITTPSHMTLGELGLQSMFAVELQQTLEREYDMKLNINDVKNITVKQMRDFQMGNKESLKNMSKEIKALKNHLHKVRFLIPTETHIRLNSVQNGNPIYFLPPVEGIFSLQENLAKKINRPVIGLNWIQDMRNLNKMKDISNHYINLLKNLSPNGNYDIVGHSFGALILTKMLRKAPIRRAVIIDVLSNSKFEDEVISDEYFFEFIEKFIRSMFVSETIRERVSRDLNKIKDIDGKLKKLSSELREFGGKGLVDKDLDEILRNTYERAKLIYNYRSKSVKKFKKFKENLGKKFLQTNGKLFIIKPFEESNERDFVERISETYFLPEKDFEEKLSVETMNANPDEVMVGYYDKVAQLINQYLK